MREVPRWDLRSGLPFWVQASMQTSLCVRVRAPLTFRTREHSLYHTGLDYLTLYTMHAIYSISEFIDNFTIRNLNNQLGKLRRVK